MAFTVICIFLAEYKCSNSVFHLCEISTMVVRFPAVRRVYVAALACSMDGGRGD